MGRTNFSGPVAGAYNSFSWGVDQIASKTIIKSWKAPANFRIDEISFEIDDVTITNAVTYVVAANAVDVIASRAAPADDVFEIFTPTSSPALLVRNMTKGHVLTLTTVTGVADTIVGGTFTVSGHFTGHIVANERND